jgi:hypothetical protein
MNFERFDKAEFDVLDCAVSGGYYPKGVNKDRALLLMETGIFVNTPISKWYKVGWKLTDKGKEYYEEFMLAVRNKHGHVWKTNRESNPDLYDEYDSYGDQLNKFAFESGYHNGYVCKNCGYSFCMHCTSEIDVPECTNKTIDASFRNPFLLLK